MISFSTFLTEARTAPLYHATAHWMQILKDGQFKPETEHVDWTLLKAPIKIKAGFFGSKLIVGVGPKNEKRHNIRGLSLSRNYRFAKIWTTMSSKKKSTDFVIFEFDQNALSHNYQIKPVNYYLSYHVRQEGDMSRGNEYEEFVLTDKPISLKYVTKIYYLDDNNLEEIKRLLDTKGLNIPLEKTKQ